ncbi:MAG: alpha-glucan family phosphorylase [Chlamydiae bacterium]|nr:alpha-glucan family phosphorylase [Chlamydiota bacterium]MBI3267232.1 alpha-glucan family phosphorylase [Chlamydiota bacterium]
MPQNKFVSQIEHFNTRYKEDIAGDSYFGKPLAPVKMAEEKLSSKGTPSIAYFSMEYGLAPNIYNPFHVKKPVHPKGMHYDHEVFSNLRAMDYFHYLRVERPPDLPIYSGGLGVLAGDTLKSAADLGLSMVGVGILWHEGYFEQKFLFHDGQVPMPMLWDPYAFPGLIPLKNHVKIQLKEDVIHLRLWKYYVYGFEDKSVIPLVLLDSHLPENTEEIRKLTYRLYRSDDEWWKFLQRTILGMGGILALDELGYSIDEFHLNEGHAAFAYVAKACGLPEAEQKNLQKKFLYTCHTPVAAGHDRFSMKLAEKILPFDKMEIVARWGQDPHQSELINMTCLAMNASRAINAVSQLHGKVTRLQFPNFKEKLKAITNGVHHLTWVSEPMAQLFDQFQKEIGSWREDPTLLKKAEKLMGNNAFREGLWKAHQENKQRLSQFLKPWKLDPDLFTIGWARRIAGYKRPGLLLHDAQKLLDMTKRVGPIQVLIAGKAHPNDNVGRGIISEMLSKIDQLNMRYEDLKVIMLENYDTYFGRLLTSSVDVWLNNPLPPFEASGTSGMKAILNGVIQLSTLDGWVAEAEDTGIARIFGYRSKDGAAIANEHDWKMEEDSKALYKELEELLDLYYRTHRKGSLQTDSQWVDMMIHCVSQAGFFNTHRMVKEYQEKMWGMGQ